MIASIIGIICGIILSLLLSNQVLGLMLTNLGMNNMKTNNTLLDYTLLIVLGSIVSYIGAYIASRRIRRISTRELVVE
jgi:ABC-type antimicrobial peptide transport system permease subunit